MDVNLNEVINLANEMYLWHQGAVNKRRWGQCVFNAAYEMYPDLADALRGSEVDCFYLDERADNFLSALRAEGLDEKVLVR